MLHVQSSLETRAQPGARTREQGLRESRRAFVGPDPAPSPAAGRALRLEQLLGSLGERLAERNEPFELIVVGGSALAAEGLLRRSTYDVDVLAVLRKGQPAHSNPLPGELFDAEREVLLEFGLSEGFLDAWVPAHMLELGLPDGLLTRLHPQAYGPALTVHFVSRFDQIHFKCLAMIENEEHRQKHETDLRALEPTGEELVAAVSWAQRLLCERIQQTQMILQEQLLRDGRRDAVLLKLLAIRLAPRSTRYRVGEWMMKGPRWWGWSYASLIGLAGDLRRLREIAGVLVASS